MPLGHCVPIKPQQAGKLRLAPQLTDNGRMESNESIHITHDDGHLPSRQAGYSPSANRTDLCDELAPDREVSVAQQKRPESYSAVQAEIGKRIKWARELVEPNRAAFARLMGCDRTTLQKIEDGDRAPSIFNVLDIAHRLRVSPDYILTGSLRGVDGELAGLLAVHHPELVCSGTESGDGKHPQPRRPKRA
jgi:transcriptional regulator with XRE-family HTH domain